MDNNMIPYAISIWELSTYFLYNRCKFIENDKIEEGSLLNRTNSRLDPFDYHVENCVVDSFKKIESSLIHAFWPDVGEDEEDNGDDVEDDVEEDVKVHELEYNDGSNEFVKTIKTVFYVLNEDSNYFFKQCGHQCICEECYQNKGNIDIIKCFVCRT